MTWDEFCCFHQAKGKAKRAKGEAVRRRLRREISVHRSLSSVPPKLIRLGITAWARLRQRESALDREAMDDALAVLGWDLAEEMRDGALMMVPEFKRARRSESREASAAHSGWMEGERRCVMLLNMLDRMEEAK